MSTKTGENFVLISQTIFEQFKINQNLSLALDLQSYILDIQRYKIYDWRTKASDKFWLNSNCSKLVQAINTKFTKVFLLIRFQLFAIFEGSGLFWCL